MTLRHMKVFVTVCRTGSTIAAAKELYTSQPAVSVAISELEQNYGVKLFDRISKRLHLTEAGERMLHYAEHILQLFGEMEQGLMDGDAVGTLRVGTTLNIGGYYMGGKVAALKKLYPELTVLVTASNADSVVESVLKNDLDVAVVEGEPDDPFLVSVPCMTDRIVFICSPNHPFAGRVDVALEDVVKEPMMLLAKGTAIRTNFDGLLATRGLKANVLWSCDSSFPCFSAVENGLGISVLPLLHTSGWISSGRVATFGVKGLEMSHKITAIYHKNKYLTRSAQDFIELWKEQ